MAKKFVRGVTDVDDIEKFDKSLTNVNDIISDGQNTYVHTKKGKNESYYKLTDSVKNVTSSDSGLITVTKDDTNGTVSIQANHDSQKEQSLESGRDTITIEKGSNGTNTKTKVDTNPIKVLEHDNLSGNTNYVKIEHTSGTNTTLINSNNISQKFETVDNTLLIKQDKLMAGDGIQLKNNIISVIHVPQTVVDLNKVITTQYLKVENGSTNLPKGATYYGILSVVQIGGVAQQTYQTLDNNGLYIRTGYRLDKEANWMPWQKIVTQPVS